MPTRVLQICRLSLVPAILASHTVAQQSPATTEPAPELKGLQWQINEWTLKLGGYVKLDLIHDFDAIGSTDSFDPRTIPTDGSQGTNTRMHARSSRLNLDLRAPTSTYPLRVFIEGDFFGDGNAFRLRHAFGEMNGLSAGQRWTNFMDENGFAETLDFESPIGFPQIRQAQVRYTRELASGDSYAFSIEDPASVIVQPATVPGETEEVLPDLTAHYIWNTSEQSHVQLGVFGGTATFDPDGGARDTVPLWGVNLSTKFPAFDEDSAILQLTYGDGVGRYRGGTTAAPDADGDLEAITTAAVMATYQHVWSEKYRSNVVYSWVDGDLPAGTPVTSPETLQYFALNLIWQFSDRAWAGIEYLRGTNDTFDGNDGNANRLQMSIKFSL